ncbi:uncharacterized protein LOC142235239 [Haematobia irritans]|uniref:uncharacterized protein LOC142235239 n=1 Tax=Haematobia irritans TaxID=7368 RepID=UPI003F5034EC
MDILKIFTLSLILGVAMGQMIRDENPDLHAENFISSHKRMCDDNLKDYDSRLESFKDNYNGRISTIDTQREFLVSSMEHTNDRLESFELLNDVTKECVNQNKMELSITNVKDMIQNCSNTANSKLETLLAPLLETRNALSSYYDQTLSEEFGKCLTPVEPLNITQCLKDVVTLSGTFTVTNRKTFDYQLDAANCVGDTFVKMALDCSFVAQSTTIALITATNVLIDRCAKGFSECVPCERKLPCENVREIPASMIDYTNQTMTNLFYNSNETISCMTINIV